jgi:hypothetical protein
MGPVPADDPCAGLQLKVLWCDAHVVEIAVSISNGDFAARTTLYAAAQQLHEVAVILRGFPTSTTDARDVVLGAPDATLAGGGVSLRFRCLDDVGHAVVEASVRADPRARGEQTARFPVRIDPAAVDRFVAALADTRMEPGACAVLAARTD